MKMLKNVLEGDAFATSRIPIPSRPCMKREADLRYVAPRREPPVQVRPLHHHAEDVAVAVAEPVDGVDARDYEKKKDIKTGSFLPPSQNHVWPMSKRYVWPMSKHQTQTHTTST